MYVKKIKKIFSVIMFVTVGLLSFGEDWVLAGEKFKYTQHASVSSAQNEMASSLPKLILEQISSFSKRVPSAQELHDRKQESLLQERLSLFLQLSAAVKKRDALFLTQTDSHKLKNEIEEQKIKISEIEKKISENLKKADEYNVVLKEALNSEYEVPSQYPGISFFSKKSTNEFLYRSEEKVSIYGNGDKLFDAGENVLSDRKYEKSVIDAKIKGLIKGSITVYGEYMMVNCELHVFPGNKVIGAVNEVGSVDDLLSISKNIGQALMPLIANAKPIDVYLDLDPFEIKDSVKLNIDGIVYNPVPEKVSLSSGFHTLDFSCEGYNDVSISWDFSEQECFFVHVPMRKKEIGDFSIFLKNSINGMLYLNGQLVGNLQDGILNESVTIDGRPYIGQIVSSEHKMVEEKKKSVDEDGNEIEEISMVDKGAYNSFFYIPTDVQQDKNIVVLKSNPVDLSAEIETRRLWMYGSYSALVVSLPFTLITKGIFDSSIQGYYTGAVDKNTVHAWNAVRWVAGGISIACGSFFVFELVRYLYTAGKVVPTEGKISKDPGIIEKRKEELQTKEFELDELESEKVTETSESIEEKNDKEDVDQ